MSVGTAKEIKRWRQELRRILSDVIGVNVGQLGKMKKRVQDIPEALQMVSKTVAEDDTPLNLEALFGDDG